MPAILSGPSFAADVARGLPTAVTVAAADEAIARALAHAINSDTFRPYHATDMRGVEIGGAVKNVLAIAAGIVTGRALGASALAALTTRGFAELVRFGSACGAKTETMMGLSGLGDLILTCSTPQSRNFSFGVALGKGGRADTHGKLAEGAFTAPVLLEMARAKNVEMPIAEAVAAVLAQEAERGRRDRVAADAAAEGGRMTMAYWLMKSEPDAWSWDSQVKKGAKGEAWTGVRNHQAKLNLMKMKKGDRAFFYHSNVGKEIVGIVEIIREHYPDPTAKPASPGWSST